LNKDKSAATRTHSFGMVHRDFRAIRHRHANHFAHGTLRFSTLNLFQNNALRQFVISKQVQDEHWVETNDNRHLASQQNPC
jgi:hypothetical protein